ncbi:MAG: carbohydrate ABC transporter permease [Anaerolineae bacterium]|nr:carbohydrate ABC transporter permease [Anaerolineae bacterium]
MANQTTTSTNNFGHYKLRAGLAKGLMYLLLAIGAVIAIFPFLWMLQTSFKTYGEHGARKLWPAALTASPYSNRPAAKHIVVPMVPAENWRNIPRSYSTPLEGAFLVEDVSDYVAERTANSNEGSLPLEVLILAIDTTDDMTQNYNEFMLTVGSRIVKQFTTRIKGSQTGGPDYFAADRGRWGPHFQVLNPDPNHFVVKQYWNVWIMLFNNYKTAWTEADFSLYMRNSLIITLLTVAGVLVTGTLAAYAFARMEFPGKNFIFTLYLATYMIPGAVTIIPNYLIIVGLEEFFTQKFGMSSLWYDNWTALTIPFMINAFSVFLLRQFFAQIPDELYEASLMDGCGHLRFLRQIVLPLSTAPVMSVVIFNTIWAWNQLQWPLMVTNSDRWRPITVGLTSFIRESAAETQLVMAGSVITTIPILVLYFFTQKQFTEGIATTGLKG